ncbi:YaaC family protein [Rhodanobacter sp. L36]|uniref:YaaC family protein n=1 Tax=Rhodanobacter sp. L36 TaxID=1747221 RepID=UPI00131E737D|nr:YaaC family protein [Rhodanobacter sp. L36]
MAFVDISYKGSPLTVHKAVTSPRFGDKTVLVTDTWDYVDLWLRRSHQSEARFYWQQSRSFYAATKELPRTAAPLTAYYCFLNAVKAMLIAKGVAFNDQHGVSGYTIKDRTSLSNEKVRFKGGGILPALATCLGEPAIAVDYSLGDLLYNLPYIHRAYDLTFESSIELFIPVTNPKVVRRDKEAWFTAELSGKYATEKTILKLPAGYERSPSDDGRFLIRRKKRFKWEPQKRTASIARYCTYHQSLRAQIHYICGPQRLWYIKRGGNIPAIIARSPMTIAFAAMHRLSEMSRYNPDRLARHFECQHNWLLSEFIETAPMQFIDEISSEMTGREFMQPGRASRR